MNVHAHRRIDGIDFWRGFALLSIFVNHAPDNIFAHLTHRNFGFSDAAEAFVFLSGVSVALAYGRRFIDGQVARAVRAMYRRMLTLYSVQIIVSFLGIAILAAAAILLDEDDLTEDEDRDAVLSRPLRGLVGILGLTHQLGFFNILPPYIAFLLVAPALLALARIDRRLMLAASAALYLAARLFSLQLPTWPLPGGWFFNPLAWQLLFAIGLFVGLDAKGGGPSCDRRLFVLSLVVLAASLFVLTDGFTLQHGLWDGIRGALNHDKTSLGLARLVHFLALAYVVHHCGVTRLLRKTPVFAPLCLIGRHSLMVFATGAVLGVVGEVILATEVPPAPAAFLIVVGGIAVQYFAARVLAARAAAIRERAAATAVASTLALHSATPSRLPRVTAGGDLVVSDAGSIVPSAPPLMEHEARCGSKEPAPMSRPTT